MGLYEVPLSMSLFGFGMGTMLANFHLCGIHHQKVSYLHKDVDCYSARNLDQTILSFANRNSSIGGLFVNLLR